MPGTLNSSNTTPPEPPRTGLYKRFFAWILSKLQRHYGVEVDKRKKELLGELYGTVIEIGAGAGANFEFYPHDARVLLIEPNAHMRPYLEATAREYEASFEIRGGTAERMEVADATADFVVSTLVLCSVDDPEAALREVVRVLKPGGRFIFLEHVAAARGTRTRTWQRRLRGFWRRIGDGCTLDRETWAHIEEAGFASADIEHFEAENLSIVNPHIAGTATKA